MTQMSILGHRVHKKFSYGRQHAWRDMRLVTKKCIIHMHYVCTVLNYLYIFTSSLERKKLQRTCHAPLHVMCHNKLDPFYSIDMIFHISCWRSPILVPTEKGTCDFLVVNNGNCGHNYLIYNIKCIAKFNKKLSYCNQDMLSIIWTSSAVAERPCDASYHWIFCEVTQGHSKWYCWVGRVWVPISFSLKLCLYVEPFMRYSASKNGVTLKLKAGVVQGHWRWRHSIDHTQLSIGPPL